MNFQTYFKVSSALMMILAASCNNNSENNQYVSYIGQYPSAKKPGSVAELFSPGLINTGPHTRDIAISPDGREIYFCMSVSRISAILFTRFENGAWSKPEVVVHLNNPSWFYFEPCLTSDGKRLFFLSNMPDTANGKKEPDEDIWYMDRAVNGWSNPVNLGAPVNTADEEYYPSLTNDGTLYFTRAKKGEQVQYLYRSRFAGGKFSEPEILPENVNCGRSRFNATISRDESFIIVPATGMPDSFGGTDYYISFRDKDDNWSVPVNMGPSINTSSEKEYSSSLSPDGRYLFFMSQRGQDLSVNFTYETMKKSYIEPGYANSAIYWVDASLIDSLKSIAVSNRLRR